MQFDPFMWGRNGEILTPDEVRRQREIADFERSRAGDTSPVGHWSQGATRVVNALGGVLADRRAGRHERDGRAAATEAWESNPVLSALLGGTSVTSGTSGGGYSGGGYVPPATNSGPPATGTFEVDGTPVSPEADLAPIPEVEVATPDAPVVLGGQATADRPYVDVSGGDVPPTPGVVEALTPYEEMQARFAASGNGVTQTEAGSLRPVPGQTLPPIDFLPQDLMGEGMLPGGVSGGGGNTGVTGSAGGDTLGTGMEPFRNAIASIESDGSGGYAAIGPRDRRYGRPLGRYQVMEANLPEWSNAALGRTVTADEFLANPDIQDAIFDHRFGGYVDQYGPEGAARAWFSGEGGMNNMGASDVLGTSNAEYSRRFNQALGGGGGSPAPSGTPGGGVTMSAQNSGGQGVIGALSAAMADPWTAEVYGPVIEALMGQQLGRSDMEFEQQLAQSDPMYQAELAQMMNPPAAPRPMTSDERSFWGIPPSDTTPYMMTPDGPRAIGGGSGQTINIGGGEGTGQFIYGTDAGVPAGWRVDTVTGEASPIPGGPVDVEMRSTEEAGERSGTQRQLRLGTTLESLNLNLAEIEDGGLPVTGGIGDLRRTGLGRLLTGDGAVDFGNRTNQITDSAALGEIQNMRDNSPTGGAVGNLTDSERVAIGNSVTALNNSTSAEEYARAATAYRELALNLAFGEGTWELGADGSVTMRNPEPEGDPRGGVLPTTPAPTLGEYDFSQMSREELAQVDISSLTPEQMDAMMARFEELSQ